MTEQIESKVCTGLCGESKPIFEFQLRKSGPRAGSRDSRCKGCVKKYHPYTPSSVRKRQSNQFYMNDPWGHKARAARKAALKSQRKGV